jgi:hypothetical protein
MTNSIFWDVTPFGPLKVNLKQILPTTQGLFFDIDDIGDMFLRNIGSLSTDYTAFLSVESIEV